MTHLKIIWVTPLMHAKRGVTLPPRRRAGTAAELKSVVVPFKIAAETPVRGEAIRRSLPRPFRDRCGRQICANQRAASFASWQPPYRCRPRPHRRPLPPCPTLGPTRRALLHAGTWQNCAVRPTLSSLGPAVARRMEGMPRSRLKWQGNAN